MYGHTLSDATRTWYKCEHHAIYLLLAALCPPVRPAPEAAAAADAFLAALKAALENSLCVWMHAYVWI